jgi:glycosyltransferase involved in cell wall biosynthesis
LTTGAESTTLRLDLRAMNRASSSSASSSESAGPLESDQSSGHVRISVVLPIHNEEPNLGPLMEELDQVLRGMNVPYEILAIDDGSTDGSRRVLRNLCREYPALRALFFRHNSGQTAAFDAGFRNVAGDVVVTMDADLQNDPHDIPKMVGLLDEGYDLVSGWRRERKDHAMRTIPSRIANWIIRRVTRAPVHDLGCSLKAYKREITDDLHLYGEMHRFIAPLADALGARVTEIPVNHRPRRAGTSKYGFGRVAKVVLDLVTVWFMRGYQTKPIYVFGGVGIASMALSFLVSLVVLYEKFVLGAWVHRNPLFLVAILFAMVGVQLLGTGLLAEIMIRAWFEASNRAAYTIVERIGYSKYPGGMASDEDQETLLAHPSSSHSARG